jgi:hypothetical protein
LQNGMGGNYLTRDLAWVEMNPQKIQLYGYKFWENCRKTLNSV